MFDFVISGNRKRRLGKLLVVSGATSIAAHLLALLFLIEYPLPGPSIWRLRPSRQTQIEIDIENWRLVTNLPTKMTMPSPETLKKLFSGSEKKLPEPKPVVEIKTPKPKPIPTPLNNPKAAISNPPSNPKVSVEAKTALPPPDMEPTPPVSITSKPETGGPESTAGNQNNSNAKKQEPVSLHPPAPEAKSEVTMSIPPPKPDPIKATPDIPSISPGSSNVSEGGKKVDIIIPGNESKDFPMGDYLNLIAEMIKEKWLIPSYLKNSRGRTTVLFFIEKDGRAMNVRILTPSGSNPLDMAALSAVLSSNLPALPKGFPGEHIGVRFKFSYEHP
jgi:TonB family protein